MFLLAGTRFCSAKLKNLQFVCFQTEKYSKFSNYNAIAVLFLACSAASFLGFRASRVLVLVLVLVVSCAIKQS